VFENCRKAVFICCSGGLWSCEKNPAIGPEMDG